MTRGESPPPSYHACDRSSHESRDEGSLGLDIESGVSSSPAPFVASSFSQTPLPPSPLRTASARPTSQPIPLQLIQEPSILRSYGPQSQPAGPRTGVLGAVQPKYPFADPEGSTSTVDSTTIDRAPGWWKVQLKKIERYLPLLIINLPFIVMFLMDIIGTHIIPKSAYYRNVVQSSPFRATFIALGATMAVLNAIGLLNRPYDTERPLTRPRRSSVGHIIVFFLATFGVGLWPMIEVWGIQKNIHPTHTCEERGFRSSILLEVLGGKTGLRGISRFPNNATIRSGDEIFGLSLSPTIRQWDDYDEFWLTPLPQTTSKDIFPRVAGYEVTIFLSEKIHQFRHAQPGENNTYVLKNGTFADNPNYYLSFPTLSPPMHSTKKTNWTYVDTRPWVELVNDERTVLKTVANQHGDRVNTMMRMCGGWTVTEMMEDLEKMEAVLVGLARVMIELMKWGLDY